MDLVEDAFVNGVLVKPMELSEQLKELLKLEDDLTFILPDSFYFTTRIEGDVVTDEEIKHALLMLITTTGFPTFMEAYAVFKKMKQLLAIKLREFVQIAFGDIRKFNAGTAGL